MCQVPEAACTPAQSTNAKPLNPNASPFKPPTGPSEDLPPEVSFFPCETFQHPPPLPVMTRWFYHQPVYTYHSRPVWSSCQVKVECYNAFAQPVLGNFTPFVMSGVAQDCRRDIGVSPQEMMNISAKDFEFLEYYGDRDFKGKKRTRRPRKGAMKQWFPKIDDKKDGGSTITVHSHDSDHEARLSGKTSLMIKNIPNQFERHDLLRILDLHCREENLHAKFRSDPCRSQYDFVYLPMDFGFRANLGYAFVNFTNAVAAGRFSRAFHKHEWLAQVPGPGNKKKICEITYAFIQGKEALINHFENSKFPCHTNGYLPVVLYPPRDGWNRSRPAVVGRRIDAGACPPVNRRKFMLRMTKKKVLIN